MPSLPRAVTLPIAGNTTKPMQHQALSSSVGDYVKAIWKVAGLGVASTKDISVRLSVTPASVTNMLGHLQEMGLVEYERYHGASSLTERGHAEALRLVRRHRLIETFLLEHLGYSWQEVHEEAERLEHAVSDKFAERLAELLSHPRHGPYGDPIPGPNGAGGIHPPRRGDSRAPGPYSQGERRGHLEAEPPRGAGACRLLSVKEVRALDGVVTVEDEDGNTHSLGGPLAGSIFVRSYSEPVHG